MGDNCTNVNLFSESPTVSSVSPSYRTVTTRPQGIGPGDRGLRQLGDGWLMGDNCTNVNLFSESPTVSSVSPSYRTVTTRPQGTGPGDRGLRLLGDGWLMGITVQMSTYSLNLRLYLQFHPVTGLLPPDPRG